MITVRLMKDSDCKLISDALKSDGNNKSIEVFINYFVEQQNKRRIILVAELDEEFAGYVTIFFEPSYANFKDNKVIEVKDLYTLEKFRGQGVAYSLLDFAEKLISDFYDYMGVIIPVSARYGISQSLFCKRGYFPDGLGLNYKDQSVSYGNEIKNDDSLTLAYIKRLR